MATPREVKVGAFVLVALCVIGLVVFLIGEQRQLFSDRVDYITTFKDVQGLGRGSPVRMGGVDVGRVTEIGYGEKATDDTIYVKLDVVENEARRIRKDSRARIEDKGLLGDKMLVISVGSPDQPPVPPNGVIQSEQERDLQALMADVRNIAARAERVVTNLETTTSALAEEEFTEDMQRAVTSLSRILESIDQGQGYIGRLIHDPEEAERLSRTVANLERASARLDGVLGTTEQVVRRVQAGPGFAHEVIYGEDGSKALAQIGGAADEMGQTLRGIREGNGLAHSVIYGDEGSQQLMSNLNEMSADLRDVASGLKEGKGTLGALLVDPSVYEDVKMLLGNVGRNRSLRALVRYSIQQDETRPGVEDPGASGTRSVSTPADAATSASASTP